MEVKETLEFILKLAERNYVDKPYIVGGLARDVYLGKEIKTSDVDLTTNSADILRLGVLTAIELNVPFDLSDDGHITVYTDSFDLDFSSNFESVEVFGEIPVEKHGVVEAFSRDFTINTLHMDISTRKIFDPTEMAFQDIKDMVIRTPVNPDITFRDDPRRIYRAINLAVRYDFDIHSDIVDYALSNKELFESEKVKEKFVTAKMSKALQVNPDKTIELLKKLDLFKNVPLVGKFKDVVIEKRMLSEFLEDA